MIRALRHGFTIVELIVVIAVMSILVTIVGLLYISVQEQARDTQLRDAALRVSDGIELFSAKYGHFPAGGFGATTAIGGNECSDGVNGFFGKNVYICTVEDTLVASGYLPAGFSSKLPKNTLYNPTSTTNLSLMVYARTVSGKQKAMVFYTMENQTDKDKADFEAELIKCGYVPASTIGPRDSWGMRNGICTDL